MNVVSFLLGNSPAYEFYLPTFRSTLLFHLHGQVGINFICRHFGTLFHLHRQVDTYLPAYVDGTDKMFRNVGT